MVQHQDSPLSPCSGKMGHTLKSASSNLPSISEESDGIQETDLISVVFQRNQKHIRQENCRFLTESLEDNVQHGYEEDV